MTHERLFKYLVPVATIVLLLASGEGIARWTESRWASSASVALAPKEPGVIRVVFYGESTVHGTPVPELGFVAQLRYALETRHPRRRFELINMAVPGISSTQLLVRMRGSLRADIDLAIVAVGHNEFLTPPASRVPPPALARRSALYRYLVATRARTVPRTRDPNRVDPTYVEPVRRDLPAFNTRQAVFEANIAEIIRVTKAAGIPLVIGTLGSNLRDWPPVFRRLPPSYRDTAYEATVAAALGDELAGRMERVDAAARALLTQHADDAMGFFLRGHVLLAQGKPLPARVAFEAAKDADPMPWRAVSAFNAAVARAATAARVPLVRFEDAFAEATGGGPPGFALFSDNVHPTPEGNALITRLLLPEVERVLMLTREAGTADDSACCALESYRRHLGDDTVQRLMLDYLLRNAQYAMKPPFFSYGTARMYLARADSVSPGDWRVEANLATVDLLQGRRLQGIEWLRRALAHARSAGAAVDENNVADTPYLWKALRATGVALDSLRR